jgi:hypothetical protein
MRRLAAVSDRLSPPADGALQHAREFLTGDLIGLRCMARGPGRRREGTAA